MTFLPPAFLFSRVGLGTPRRGEAGSVVGTAHAGYRYTGAVVLRVDELAAADIDTDVRGAGHIGVGPDENVARLEVAGRNRRPNAQVTGSAGPGANAVLGQHPVNEAGAIKPTRGRAFAAPDIPPAQVFLGERR